MNPVNCVIYARSSSGGQRDESIEGQLRDCHDYADRNGLNVIAEYCDHALTGTSDHRPEFQQMINDSENGDFSVVLVWKIDRFSRDRYDSAAYKNKLKKNGVRVQSVKEYISEGPEGIILESVMEGFAEYYSANLSQNVKWGNYSSALKRQTLGQRVLGYRQGADKRFEIDPETAPIIRRIFTDYAAGKTAKQIINALNNEGYRTIRGNPFNHNSIPKILKNEKYIGVYRFGEVYDENGIPPIIDRDLFEQCQKKLERNKEAPAAKRSEGGYLLTGKLFCGECGEGMTGDSGTSKSGVVHQYYLCNNRRRKLCKKERAPKQWIEDIIVGKLLEIICDDKIVNIIADRFMEWQEQHTDNSKVTAIEKNLKDVEAKLANNLKLVDMGIITDEVQKHLVELSEAKASMQRELAAAKFEVSDPKIERSDLIWYFTKLKESDITSHADRVTLIDALLNSAYLFDDDRLILHLNFSGDESQITLPAALSDH